MSATTEKQPASVDTLPRPRSASLFDRLRFATYLRLSGTGSQWRLKEAIATSQIRYFDRLVALGIVPRSPEAAERLIPVCLGRPDGARFIARLAALGARVSHVPQDGYNMPWLHRAAVAGDEAAVKALLAAGADAQARNGSQETAALAALRGAATSGTGHGQQRVPAAWRIVEACLEAGCPPTATDDSDNSIFSYALLDTPRRVTWALGLPGVRDWVLGKDAETLAAPARTYGRHQVPPHLRVRTALETVLFTGVEDALQEYGYCATPSLIAARASGAPGTVYAKRAILAALDGLAPDYAGENAAGETLLETGIASGNLRPGDVPFLVQRGAPLAVLDSKGNTLTHQLAKTQSLANEKGRALLAALHAAGLPDQRAERNVEGRTPIECRNTFIDTWYGANMQALQKELEPIRPPAPRHASVHIRHLPRNRR